MEDNTKKNLENESMDENQNFDEKSSETEQKETHKNQNEIDEEKKMHDEANKKFLEMVQELNNKYMKLIEDYEKLKAENTMLKIEFNDFMKKSQNEIVETKTIAIKKFATEMIAVMSIVDLAKKSCQHDTNMLIGLEMLEKQFLEALKNFKITKKEIKIGDIFDEKICEAVDSEIGEPVGTICKIISYPYLIESNLLLAGRVVVFRSA